MTILALLSNAQWSISLNSSLLLPANKIQLFSSITLLIALIYSGNSNDPSTGKP